MNNNARHKNVLENRALNIVGIITARGGSVRLPRKNLRRLSGKPLITYMIKAARKSKYLKRVIVSTDHPGIKKVSLQCGAEVPFKRPKNISGNCSSILVVQHAVRFLEKEEKRRIDIAVTLQPTAPFCQSEDIDLCIELLLKNKNMQSAFSAVEIHQRPEWMFKLKNGKYGELYISGRIKGARGTKQRLPKLVMPNGAVYVTRREALFGESVIISKKTGIYEMPKERSVDIDEESDLRYAEFLLSKLK